MSSAVSHSRTTRRRAARWCAAARLATPEDVARETADADGIIITTHPFGAEHIAALGPRVRVIGRAGIGLDAIDTEAASEAGVAVINFPDYATNEVATHAVALLLALQRRLVEADRLARAPWGDQAWLGEMAPLETLTLGLVGLGRIGRAVGRAHRPLVGAVQAYDPASPPLPAGVNGCASLGSCSPAATSCRCTCRCCPRRCG